MSSISLRGITKRFGRGERVLDDVNLEIENGERLVLVGPSGCGKSTLLRVIAGLEDATVGEIFIDGERVTEKAPRERNLAMVFQSYALYPHLSAFENIAFPLRLSARRDEVEIRRKVEEAARTLQLTELLQRKPGQLSGGQRQRVAMGRAMVRGARAFLFDEPLSNLDARLRDQMRTELSRLQRRLGVTTVYVTHDQTEAMTLGDRVAVLLRGQLQQVARPRELYQEPANLFVALFIGSPPMNVVPASLDGRRVKLPFAEYDVTEEAARRLGGDRTLLAGIRPECFEVAGRAGPTREGGATFRAAVDVVEWLGAVQYAHLPCEVPGEIAARTGRILRELGLEPLRMQLTVSLPPESDVREGKEIDLSFDPRRVHFFDDRAPPWRNLE